MDKWKKKNEIATWWMCRVTRRDRDQERTHTRNNEGGAGLQNDHREKIDLVRACDEERWRTYTEESVENGYTREKEERTTENKMERRVSTRCENTGLRAGEETDRAMWRKKIRGHTGVTTWWEKLGEKKKTKMTRRDTDLSYLDAAWFRDPANDARRR